MGYDKNFRMITTIWKATTQNMPTFKQKKIKKLDNFYCPCDSESDDVVNESSKSQNPLT